MAETDSEVKNVTRGNIWLDFLGSMNLAITILVIIAVASVIGTVLQQNQQYNDYIIKFGPFWHEVFKTINLYDVYSAGWFLALLFFLLLSTSVCIYRNAPVMIHDMRNFRLNAQLKTLCTMANSVKWQLAGEQESAVATVKQLLQVHGYQLREKQHADRLVISGMRGKWNRLGYIFAHAGIIVICIGGFLDGTFDIALREWTGKSKIDLNTEFVRDMPEESTLKPGDLISFRGNLSIAEGQRANFALLRVRDGTLVQYLPFAIELKDFRIEHYESGQPKSFESDLVIYDDQLDKPLDATIAVNHPLIYRGYHIYQASFGDGGTQMKLKIWPFYDYKLRTLETEGTVHGERVLDTAFGSRTLEFSDFKQYNVVPAPKNDPLRRKFRNDGPSMVFKVRDESGVAREYFNYMSPIEQKGRYFFVSGVRRTSAEQYGFISIPADEKTSIDRFMQFHALLNNSARALEIAQSAVDRVLKDAPDRKKYRDSIIKSMMELLGQFNQGGYSAIDQYIDQAKVDVKQKENMAQAYFKVLDTLMKAIYVDVLRQEGLNIEAGLSKAQEQFYFDAIDALRQLHLYGSPFYVQLNDYKLRESSGLSIAKLPGKNIVYLGSLMVIIGVFLLFYIVHERIWAVFYMDDAGDRWLLFSGSGNRNQSDFTGHFNELYGKLDAKFSA